MRPAEQLAQALIAVLGDHGSGDNSPSVTAHSRYVTIALAARLTGFTEKAIRRKIEDGVWIETREWVRAPDGHLLIDMQGYEQWVVAVAA